MSDDPSKLRKFPDLDIPNAGKTLEGLMSDTATDHSPGSIIGVVLGEGIEPAARANMEALLQDTCAITDALEHSIQEITAEAGGLEMLHSMLIDALTNRPTADELKGEDSGEE